MSIKTIYISLWNRIERLYSGEPYFIRQKAYIFVCLMSLWVISICLSLVADVLSPLESVSALLVFFSLFAISAGIGAILFTMIGGYRIASNATCIVFFLGMIGFSIFRMNSLFLYGINPATIMFVLVLAFSSFFAGRRIFLTLSGLILLLHTALIILGKSHVCEQSLPQFFSYNVNSSITVVGLIAFLYLSSNLIDKALERADLEILKNREFTHTLETKVESRTHDLALAMRELESSNDELTRTQNSLWGEMKIAKKLQTLLIPQSPVIPGFDIAPYIKPASDVGGDYYDVINCKDHDWIAIGDVSGHGVPAGLVMMMVHTALHSILAEKSKMTPADVLKRINSVIAEYINRIDRSKYMTITLMLYTGDGHFLHSGLHLPILVYRKRADQVEEIETYGTWIGLNFEIGTEFIDSPLTLDPGDIMLLYTDGITESWITHENEGMEESALHFFGQDSLSRILLEEKNNDASRIRKRIVDELSIYDQRDDVTFLIIKRMS